MNPQVNVNSYDEINVQLHNDQPHSPTHLVLAILVNRSYAPCLQYESIASVGETVVW